MQESGKWWPNGTQLEQMHDCRHAVPVREVAQEVTAGYAIRKGQTVSAWEESESQAIVWKDSLEKIVFGGRDIVGRMAKASTGLALLRHSLIALWWVCLRVEASTGRHWSSPPLTILSVPIYS